MISAPMRISTMMRQQSFARRAINIVPSSYPCNCAIPITPPESESNVVKKKNPIYGAEEHPMTIYTAMTEAKAEDACLLSAIKHLYMSNRTGS